MNGPGAPHGVPGSRGAPAERSRILVVDGEGPARSRTARLLERAGHAVTEAATARDAWDAALGLAPHLVLLAADLPDGSAIELCRRMKSEPALRPTHVVLVLERGVTTGGARPGQPAGADTYLARPVSSRALLAHVQSMLAVQRRTAALESGRDELVEARRAALSMMQDAEAERARAEDARRRLEKSTESLRLLSQAIETSPVVVVIADPEGRIEYVNPHATRVTGYSSEELVGQHTRIFRSGRHGAEYYAEMWTTLKAGRQWRGELCNRTKTGELYWELAWIAPVVGPGGAVAHFVAVKQDITQRRLDMEELERAKLAADAANKAKSDFLASMSHELRTPLTAILGFTEVLQDQTFGPLNAKQGRYVGNVLSAAQHLLSLINDILDLAKVEAGRMELELSEVRLRALLEGGVLLVRERALKRGLEVHVESANGLTVQGDERKLKQVLFNLLSNAVKFTPEGGRITVSAARVGDDVEVSVADTGCGIKAEDQPRLFREFAQLHPGYAREHEGTGLGLALCRRLVELHGGRIWGDSPGEGRGSTFRFTLPVAGAARAAPAAGARPAATGETSVP